jgi:UMF1 family MFS transporter
MILAIMIGAVQGGIQSLSRSYFAGMIPEDESAAFFGFYNVVGKSAAVLGPVLVGVVAKLSGDAQTGVLVLSAFFIIGLVILFRLPRHGSSGASSGA